MDSLTKISSSNTLVVPFTSIQNSAFSDTGTSIFVPLLANFHSHLVAAYTEYITLVKFSLYIKE